MEAKFISEAVKIAGRSSILKHQTGAIIVQRGKIVSNGWSHVPEHKYFGDFRSLHAEMHALVRCRNTHLWGATCYVATVSRKSQRVTLAMPCLHCAIALKSAGVSTVRYTITQQRGIPHSRFMPLQSALRGLKVYRESNGN